MLRPVKGSVPVGLHVVLGRGLKAMGNQFHDIFDGSKATPRWRPNHAKRIQKNSKIINQIISCVSVIGNGAKKWSQNNLKMLDW